MHSSMSHPGKRKKKKKKNREKPQVRMYASSALFKAECPLKTVSEFPSNLATFISL